MLMLLVHGPHSRWNSGPAVGVPYVQTIWPVVVLHLALPTRGLGYKSRNCRLLPVHQKEAYLHPGDLLQCKCQWPFNLRDGANLGLLMSSPKGPRRPVGIPGAPTCADAILPPSKAYRSPLGPTDTSPRALSTWSPSSGLD